MSVAGYVILPVLVTVFVLRRPLRDLGLRTTGIASHWPAYAALYSLALPAIVIASFGGAFQAKYPFYDLGVGESFWPHLYVWWFLYAMQFVALEFFFRGFLLHGIAPRLGWISIFVMVVPYNMLHYGKPMPEAFVAIAGGIALGTLSLKTRSIWWGRVAPHLDRVDDGLPRAVARRSAVVEAAVVGAGSAVLGGLVLFPFGLAAGGRDPRGRERRDLRLARHLRLAPRAGLGRRRARRDVGSRRRDRRARACTR